MDDLDLLCHRIIQDEDQSVHETFPSAFSSSGWPRNTGNYDLRLNRLAREEDTDVVEAQIEMLLNLHRGGVTAMKKKEVPEVIVIDD